MKSAAQPLLSIVIPAYNETEGIVLFMERLKKTLDMQPVIWEAIFVDDGSTDNTWDKLLALNEQYDNITVISLSRNFGKDTAILSGLEAADGQAVVVIDADLQDPPEIIPDMIQQWEKGNDIIFGLRQTRQGESMLRRMLTTTFYRLIQAISDCDLPPNTGDFCLMDKKVVNEVKKMRERTRYFKGLISWVGFKRTTVSYCREPRRTGESKWNYFRLILFALDALTSYSRLPLRLWTIIGFSASLVGALYGGYVIAYTLFFGGDVPGYASLVVIILFLGGIQLLSIGVVSEYIGHLFIETKQRPLFIIRDIKTSPHRPKASQFQERSKKTVD